MVEIPSFTLSRQVQALWPSLEEATQRVFRRGNFILGPEVEAFEAEFARYLGAPYCIGVGSGTQAIELALRALGLGAGDEVLVPAFTAAFTALAVMAAGCQPKFVDVDAATGNLSPSALSAAIGPRTAAIIVVHLYGRPAEMDGILAISSRAGLATIEDCAQAHGASWRGSKVGTLGHVGCFSFYPTKNLGAFGDGGAVVTSDAALADKVRRLRHGGQSVRYQHEDFGTNARLDELQAAYLRVKLPLLESWNNRRREIARQYARHLGSIPGIKFPVDPPQATSVFHIMAVRVQNRDGLMKALRDMGIGTDVHYPFVVPELPPFQSPETTSFLQARLWAQEELSLPMFPELSDEEVEEVCQILAALVTASS